MYLKELKHLGLSPHTQCLASDRQCANKCNDGIPKQTNYNTNALALAPRRFHIAPSSALLPPSPVRRFYLLASPLRLLPPSPVRRFYLLASSCKPVLHSLPRSPPATTFLYTPLSLSVCKGRSSLSSSLHKRCVCCALRVQYDGVQTTGDTFNFVLFNTVAAHFIMYVQYCMLIFASSAFLFFLVFFWGGLGYTNLILCPAAIGFNVETVTYKNLKFQVWDLGGQTSIRPYWR